MTTIKDIARESGFSVSTVSRVLAGHPDVSADTAAAVQAVIDKRHFVVNRNARNLKGTGKSAILVVIKGRDNMLFASMVQHVQKAIQATGYSVATHYIDEDDNEIADAERLIGETKPAGVIFLGGDANHVAARAHLVGAECPAVVLTNTVASAGKIGISSVTTNDTAAAKLAVDYLLDRGHKRLGIIGGSPDNSMISKLRLEGAIEAMAGHGIDFDTETQFVATRFSLKSGYEAAKKLLDKAGDITAIYVMSDIMALGVRRALYERGLDVPGDISLIGHDGIEMASYVVPKLVTIRQPQEWMATRGTAILMHHLRGDLTPVEEFGDVSIIFGESVRSLAA